MATKKTYQRKRKRKKKKIEKGNQKEKKKKNCSRQQKYESKIYKKHFHQQGTMIQMEVIKKKLRTFDMSRTFDISLFE